MVEECLSVAQFTQFNFSLLKRRGSTVVAHCNVWEFAEGLLSPSNLAIIFIPNLMSWKNCLLQKKLSKC